VTPAPDGSRISDYDYALSDDRIARYPADRRDESRLLEVAAHGGLRDRVFHELPWLMAEGDLLVVNESRVLPARLLGQKPTGAAAEILLLRPLVSPDAGETAGSDDRGGRPAFFPEAREWEALVRPGRKLKPGREVVVAADLTVEIVEVLEGGTRRVRLRTDLDTREALRRYGHMPLPPYIDRDDEALDRERYQTVYARIPGSVAAPTAGLHFTDDLLKRLDDRGVERHAVTLDVGVGTFRPVETRDPADHDMHVEYYRVPGSTAEAVNRAASEGRRIWAVGTTVVRTLESAWSEGEGAVRSGPGETDLFIRPPHEFGVVDALITNFHLPRSTLLMLVAAFAGYETTMAAYRHAIEQGYRFYSYGDAMVIPGR